MADHPLRPAIDRRLGGPLPRQLANRTRANPSAINLSPPIAQRAYPALAQVSLSYSEPKGMFPRVTHPSATPRKAFAFQSVRLACVKPAASVRSEPGSNSQVELRLSPDWSLSVKLSRVNRILDEFQTHPSRRQTPQKPQSSKARKPLQRKTPERDEF